MTTTPDQITPATETLVSMTARSGASVVGPVSLVLGSVLAAVGFGLHLPAMPEDEALVRAIADDPWWLVSHLSMSFGLALVAVGAATAVGFVRGRGGKPTTAGAIATALGAMVLALSDIAHGVVSFAVVDQVDPATSLAIHEAYFSNPVILALNAGSLVLTLGMVVLGVGLFRSRVAPRWAGVVIALTPIAVQASFALRLPTYLHGLPIVIGMTTLAYLLGLRQLSNPTGA